MTRPLQIPHTLSGRYAIERELGRGAMGCVYLARDLKHGREVAVKVLATDSGQDLSAERFFSEVRTAAGLNHPHILTVHDSGEGENGLLYYVMPRVEGESLRDLLGREARLPVDDAVAIARQVATGLAYAHARGVIHRDIKPGNILLDRTGHAYLADFGLALALGSVSSVRRTATGTAVGSPLYMSPEQAAGERDLDARSDIYSLGCVLFEMLAGAPPFEGSNVRDVLVRHLTAPAPSLRSRRADVPPALDGVVRKALAKEPEERYPSATALSQALERQAPLEDGLGGPPLSVKLRSRSPGAGSAQSPGLGAGGGPLRSPGTDLTDVVIRLRQSRVVEWLIGYLAGGWLLLEALTMAGEALDWPAAILRAVMLAFVLGALGVVIVAWFHGERGRQPVTRLEAVLLSALSAAGLFGAGAVVGHSWGDDPQVADGPNAVAAVTQPELDRIAVLYLEDLSPDGSLGHLARGLTETLIGQLRSVAPLHVISSNGVRPYRDGAASLDSIARALDVGLVVAGSLQRSGDWLRVSIELTDPVSGRALEHETLERQMGDIFTLQDEIAEEVSRFLLRRVGLEIDVRERREDAPSFEVWEAYQRAEALRQDAMQLSVESPMSAVPLLRRADSVAARTEAVADDWPDVSLFRAHLALDLADLVFPQDTVLREALLQDAWHRTSEVIDRDGNHPQALYLRGRSALARFVDDPRNSDARLLELAEQNLRAAVHVDPTLATAWNSLSYVLQIGGRFEEAHHAARKALEQDAYLRDAENTIYRLFYTANELGRGQEAVEWCEHGKERFGANRFTLHCELFLLAYSPEVEPDTPRARAVYEPLQRVTGGPDSPQDPYFALHNRLLLAAVSARAGDHGRAVRMVEAVRRQASERGLDSRYQLDVARVRMLTGEPQAALASLERLLTELPWLRANVARNPAFEPLAGDTLFQRLIEDR